VLLLRAGTRASVFLSGVLVGAASARTPSFKVGLSACPAEILAAARGLVAGKSVSRCAAFAAALL